jgi:hypothetical protein
MSLEWDEEEERAPRTRSVGWRVVLLVLVLLGVFATVWYWERFPFVTDQRNIRESSQLMEAANNRWLTDDEFERVVALLNSGTESVQLSAIGILEMAANREPARRERSIAALEGCPETASPKVRHEAGQAVARLKDPQKQVDELTDKALKRRLTDDEFERVIVLLSTEPQAIQLRAILTLQIVVGRDPDRRDRVIAALEGCPETAPPKVRHEAGQAATRLKGSQ